MTLVKELATVGKVQGASNFFISIFISLIMCLCGSLLITLEPKEKENEKDKTKKKKDIITLKIISVILFIVSILLPVATYFNYKAVMSSDDYAARSAIRSTFSNNMGISIKI